MSVKRKVDRDEISEEASKSARKVLTLSQKVEVISAVDNGKSHRCVAKEFACGRTQVSNIIQNKEQILQK